MISNRRPITIASPKHSCRHADGDTAFRKVRHDGRTGTNGCSRADADTRDDATRDSQCDAFSDRHVTRNSNTRTQVNEITNAAIVVDARGRVNNDVFPDIHVCLDYTSGHDY
jgi:hypothetical protein